MPQRGRVPDVDGPPRGNIATFLTFFAIAFREENNLQERGGTFASGPNPRHESDTDTFAGRADIFAREGSYMIIHSDQNHVEVGTAGWEIPEDLRAFQDELMDGSDLLMRRSRCRYLGPPFSSPDPWVGEGPRAPPLELLVNGTFQAQGNAGTPLTESSHDEDHPHATHADEHSSPPTQDNHLGIPVV
uniref:Uncharacterized protein n=1 Tax=Aegilops tauschii TaxID=37682 RepID=M8C5X8_AEGTA